MGYLVLTRQEGEEIRITIDPGVDAEKLLQHLLRDGTTIHVTQAEAHRAKIAIEAPPEMLILRSELCEAPTDVTAGGIRSRSGGGVAWRSRSLRR